MPTSLQTPNPQALIDGLAICMGSPRWGHLKGGCSLFKHHEANLKAQPAFGQRLDKGWAPEHAGFRKGCPTMAAAAGCKQQVHLLLYWQKLLLQLESCVAFCPCSQ